MVTVQDRIGGRVVGFMADLDGDLVVAASGGLGGLGGDRFGLGLPACDAQRETAGL
jgi:hypothetical protein